MIENWYKLRDYYHVPVYLETNEDDFFVHDRRTFLKAGYDTPIIMGVRSAGTDVVVLDTIDTASLEMLLSRNFLFFFCQYDVVPGSKSTIIRLYNDWASHHNAPIIYYEHDQLRFEVPQ